MGIKSSSNEIKKSAFISYFNIAFNIISGLLFTPWIISQIGQSQYGLYTLSISILSFFSMDFGLSAAVSKFLSSYLITKNKEEASRFLGITFKLFCFITIIIFFIMIILYFFIDKIYTGIKTTELETLKILVIIAGLSSVLNYPFKPFEGIIISNEKFVFLKLINLICKILSVLGMALFLIYDKGVISLVLVNGCINTLKTISQYLFIKKYLYIKPNFSNKKTIIKNIMHFSFWTTLTGISQSLILNITPTILGVLSNSNEIAVFSVGMTIEGYVYTIAGGLGGLFLPKITKIYHKENSIDQIESLNIKVGRFQSYILGLIIVGFLLCGSEFVYLWLGNSFSRSYYIALLLILPGFFSLTYQIANTSLVVTNNLKFITFTSSITAFISIVISVIIVPRWGAMGSAIGIFIGNILGNVIFSSIVYYKVLKINMGRFFKMCHLKMIPPISITILIGILLNSMRIEKSYLGLLLKIVILIFIYIITVYKFTMNKYERNVICSFFKNLLIKS